MYEMKDKYSPCKKTMYSFRQKERRCLHYGTSAAERLQKVGRNKQLAPVGKLLAH